MRPDGTLTVPTPTADRPGLSLHVGLPSLRLVLALALGALGLASTMLLTTLVTREATARLQVEIAAQLHELAGHMARTLDQGMFERWRDIEIVASNDGLRDPATPLAAKRAMLERLQETYPLYSIIGLVGPEGRILATSKGLIRFPGE